MKLIADLTRALCVLGLVVASLAGCVQTKTTPGYARAGDHILIGLGGIVRNAGGTTDLKPGDLTITLTDAGSTAYTLEPRFIFKSYLDYGAYMNSFTLEGSGPGVGLNGMVPYDGSWVVVAPLTLPGQYDMPLPLAVGPASIAVSSTKLTNTADSLEGDLTDIPIEIIAGTSAQDTDFTRQFVGYENTTENFVIAPDDLTGITEVGGAYLVIDYNDDTFFENGVEPLVVPVDHNPYVQLQYNVASNGNGTGSIYVTLSNPAGFKTLATADPNSSFLSDLTVRLVYFSTGTPTQAKANFSLNTSASYYMDANGSEISGLTPVLTHVEDI